MRPTVCRVFLPLFLVRAFSRHYGDRGGHTIRGARGRSPNLFRFPNKDIRYGP
jgi:hypothetical protein